MKTEDYEACMARNAEHWRDAQARIDRRLARWTEYESEKANRESITAQEAERLTREGHRKIKDGPRPLSNRTQVDEPPVIEQPHPKIRAEAIEADPDTPDLSKLSMEQLRMAYDFFHSVAELNNAFYCRSNFPESLEEFIDQEVFRVDHFCNAIADEARARTCSGDDEGLSIRNKLLVHHCLNTNGGDPFIDFLAAAVEAMREQQAKA